MQNREANADSLARFLQAVIVEVPDGEEAPIQMVKLIKVKTKYEEFCFNRGYIEKNLRDNKERFADIDTEFFTINDSSTEVFRRIIFKNRKELSDLGKPSQMPNEDSLSFFVRSRCNITPFIRDVIYVKDFQHEYEKFCRAEKVSDAVPITKREMESMGSVFERLQITALRCSGRYRINLKSADLNLEEPDPNPLQPCWCCCDCCIVFLHTVLAL